MEKEFPKDQEDFSKLTEQQLIDTFVARAKAILQGRGENLWRNKNILESIVEEISKRWNHHPVEVIETLMNFFRLSKEGIFPDNDFNLAIQFIRKFSNSKLSRMEKYFMIDFLENIDFSAEQWYLLLHISGSNEAQIICAVQLSKKDKSLSNLF